MKSIEYCLDELLRQLFNNYKQDERPPLDATKFLQDVDAPLQRTEFFIGVLDILIQDNHVRFKDLPIRTIKVDASLDYYKTETMITTAGIYFLERGGYDRQSKSEFKKKRESFILATTSTLIGAIIGALITIVPQCNQEPPRISLQPNTIVLPKIQIVHDTVYVQLRIDTLK